MSFFKISKGCYFLSCLVIKIKSIASFMEKRFYQKRGFIKRYKYVKTIHANKDYKLAILVLITKLSKFVVHFCNVICANKRPWHAFFLFKNESTFSSIWHGTNDNGLSPVSNSFANGSGSRFKTLPNFSNNYLLIIKFEILMYRKYLSSMRSYLNL